MAFCKGNPDTYLAMFLVFLKRKSVLDKLLWIILSALLALAAYTIFCKQQFCFEKQLAHVYSFSDLNIVFVL